jgi:hypothetical protein
MNQLESFLIVQLLFYNVHPRKSLRAALFRTVMLDDMSMDVRYN